MWLLQVSQENTVQWNIGNGFYPLDCTCRWKLHLASGSPAPAAKLSLRRRVLFMTINGYQRIALYR